MAEDIDANLQLDAQEGRTERGHWELQDSFETSIAEMIYLLP